MGMDRPPLPSPDIQSQMGMPPEGPSEVGGLGAIARKNSAAGPQPGAPNPHGFLMAQVDAVKKVLEQIAGAEPVFAPFAQKAQSILDTGVAAVSSAPGGAAPPVEAGTAGPPPPPPGAGGQVPPMG
jgi:hypothetical protein